MQDFIGFAQENWVLLVLWLSAAGTLYYTETKKAGKSVNTTEATRMINRENALILDIREQKEFSQGHIAGAYNLPASLIKSCQSLTGIKRIRWWLFARWERLRDQSQKH
jgi:hypothetical protein